MKINLLGTSETAKSTTVNDKPEKGRDLFGISRSRKWRTVFRNFAVYSAEERGGF